MSSESLAGTHLRVRDEQRCPSCRWGVAAEGALEPTSQRPWVERGTRVPPAWGRTVAVAQGG